VPAQNMMRRQAAEEWKHRHNQIRAERVRETGMWLVSADVTGERGDTHVGFGPTSVMDPSADVVAQVPLMETGMVIAQIPQLFREAGEGPDRDAGESFDAQWHGGEPGAGRG
jgi:5-aminopentanamidase